MATSDVGLCGFARVASVVDLWRHRQDTARASVRKEHEKEYNTILWLDVRSEVTALSSFERCCQALALPVFPSGEQEALHDAASVQAVLHLAA